MFGTAPTPIQRVSGGNGQYNGSAATQRGNGQYNGSVATQRGNGQYNGSVATQQGNWKYNGSVATQQGNGKYNGSVATQQGNGQYNIIVKEFRTPIAIHCQGLCMPFTISERNRIATCETDVAMLMMKSSD